MFRVDHRLFRILVGLRSDYKMDFTGVRRQLFTSLAGTVPLADSEYFFLLCVIRFLDIASQLVEKLSMTNTIFYAV